MALRPGGPLGDMVSQNQYANELANQPALPQPPQVSQSANREPDPEAAKQQNLAENDRVAERRIREIAERFSPKETSNSNEQQRTPPKQNEQGR